MATRPGTHAAHSALGVYAEWHLKLGSLHPVSTAPGGGTDDARAGRAFSALQIGARMSGWPPGLAHMPHIVHWECMLSGTSSWAACTQFPPPQVAVQMTQGQVGHSALCKSGPG